MKKFLLLFFTFFLLLPAGMVLASEAAPLSEYGQVKEALKYAADKDLKQTKIQSVQDLIGRGIVFEVLTMGIVFLVMYIVAGVMWMTSGGSSDKIAKAKKILLWTTLSAVVVVSSYVVVKEFFDILKSTP